MIKGVVFDLDHTLFDRYATLEGCAPYFYHRFKQQLAPGLGIEDVAVNMIYADREYNCFGVGKICEYLNASGFFKQPLSEEEFLEIRGSAFSDYGVAVPFEYTNEVLEYIIQRSYKTGLITNGSCKLQNAKLSLLGIRRYFDHILICDKKELLKPNTLPFKQMAEALELKPQELMYVGDHPKNDVDASRRAGYIPVWVKVYPWKYPEIEKPKYIIDNLTELRNLL